MICVLTSKRILAVTVATMLAANASAENADSRQPLTNRELAAIGLAITATVDGGEGCVDPQGTADTADDRWREFFGTDSPRVRTRKSKTSATVLSTDGEILTHSITKYCSSYEVTLPDERVITAKPLGFDPSTDVALLQVEAVDLTAAKIGDPATVLPGDSVMAFGSPYGMTGTLSQGVVSTRDRYVPDYSDNARYIQSDAMINPGSAGGPLLNEYGEVIGIHALLMTRRNAFDGMSFALPIDIAMRVVADLREFGEVRRGWLGITIDDQEDRPGVLITDVLSGNPLDGKAAVGDRIIDLDGRTVSNAEELRQFVQMYRPGDSVTISVTRDGEVLALEVTLAERPAE